MDTRVLDVLSDPAEVFLQFEVAPDPRDQVAVSAWQAHSAAEQYALTETIARAALAILTPILGLSVGHPQIERGGFYHTTNFSVRLDVHDTPERAQELAYLLAVCLRQHSSLVVSQHEAVGLEPRRIVRARLKPTVEEATLSQRYLTELWPLTTPSGERLLRGFSQKDGVLVLVLERVSSSDEELRPVMAWITANALNWRDVWGWAQLIVPEDMPSATEVVRSVNLTPRALQSLVEKMDHEVTRAYNTIHLATAKHKEVSRVG